MNYQTRRDAQGHVRVHRTWLKVLVNPLLRLVGWQVVSVFDHDRFRRYRLQRLPHRAIVYRGFLRETPVPVVLHRITPEISEITCIECGGTGRWDFGPPGTEGACQECKGTGRVLVS